jgi:hypothetical protein
MTWIRSPWWDGFWILSAPVLGLLMLVPLAVRLPTASITIGLLCVNFGHAISPIALAWTHKGFRGVMLGQPGKFIGGPAVVIVAGVAAAVATWLMFPAFQPGRMVLENFKLDNIGVPIVLWANLYAIWNLYHAGAQNFGFLCLYRRRGWKGKQKVAMLAVCIAVSVFVGHEMSRIFSYETVFLFCFGLVTVNHWLAAIGLSAHVHARHNDCSPLWFSGGVILAGGLLVWGFHAGLRYSVHVAILTLCLRGALGIWHFLQDRWIWRLGDPQVRETIGRDIFGLDAAHSGNRAVQIGPRNYAIKR